MSLKQYFAKFFHTSYINPFSHLTDETGSLHHRRRRTSFIQKMDDTYYMFAGQSHSYLPGNNRNDYKIKTGIFDWCTLHARTLVTLLKIASATAIRKAGWLNVLLIWILLPVFLATMLVEFSLNIIFNVAAFAVTLVSALFFIPFIQGINSRATKSERELLNQQFHNIAEQSLEKSASPMLRYHSSKGQSEVETLISTQLEKDILHYKLDVNAEEMDVNDLSSTEDKNYVRKFKDNALYVEAHQDRGIVVKHQNKVIEAFMTPKSFQESNLYFFNLDKVITKAEKVNPAFTARI